MPPGHSPVGRYDEIGSSDCPGPYAVHVVLVPYYDAKILAAKSHVDPKTVRSLSVTEVYGEYAELDHAVDVLAIFSGRRVSPGGGQLVDTCVCLPFAVCKKTGRSFDLVDLLVNKVFCYTVTDRLDKWLTGTAERFRPLYEARLKAHAAKGRRRKKSLGRQVLIDLDRVEPGDDDDFDEDESDDESPRGDFPSGSLDAQEEKEDEPDDP